MMMSKGVRIKDPAFYGVERIFQRGDVGAFSEEISISAEGGTADTGIPPFLRVLSALATFEINNNNSIRRNRGDGRECKSVTARGGAGFEARYKLQLIFMPF